jgi:hypothetical protein
MRTPTKEQFNEILLFEIFDAIYEGVMMSQICLALTQQPVFKGAIGGMVKESNLDVKELVILNSDAENFIKNSDGKCNITVNFNNKKLDIYRD